MSDLTDPSASPTSRVRDPYRFIVWFILLTGPALRLYLLYAARSTHEDFYINLRYIENIAAGNGFVYNPGQHVLGTTTPLYTLVLALLARVGLDPTLCGKLLGIAADALAVLFTYRLGRSIGRPVSGLAAAVCMAFAPTNLTWATKGMEVGIVAAAAAGVWVAWAEKREVLAWSAAAVLVLLRIDGAALVAIMLVATLVRDRRIPWRGIGIFLVMIAPWAVFATLYFGSPVPLSATAKLIVYSKMIPGRFPQLPIFLRDMFHNVFGKVTAFGCMLFIVGCVMRLWPNISRRAEGEYIEQKAKKLNDFILVTPLLWIGLYYSVMAFSHVVLFGWYFVPPTPIYYLVAMTGFSVAAEHTGFREARANNRQVAAGTAALLALLLVGVPRVVKSLREDQGVETRLRIPIGMWMRGHAGPGDSLMLEPIGYIGYYSRLRIIDMIGLVSPEALPSYSANVACPTHDLWSRLHPDWLLLRWGELKALNACEATLPAEQRLGKSYVEVNSWKNPDNLGGAPAFILFENISRKNANTQRNSVK